MEPEPLLRYAEAGSGVYGCAPTKCELHTYKLSVTLGVTTLSHQQVKQVRSPEQHGSEPACPSRRSKRAPREEAIPKAR